jgi:hypothetical protein
MNDSSLHAQVDAALRRAYRIAVHGRQPHHDQVALLICVLQYGHTMRDPVPLQKLVRVAAGHVAPIHLSHGYLQTSEGQLLLALCGVCDIIGEDESCTVLRSVRALCRHLFGLIATQSHDELDALHEHVLHHAQQGLAMLSKFASPVAN